MSRMFLAAAVILGISGLSGCLVVVNPEEGELDAEWVGDYDYDDRHGEGRSPQPSELQGTAVAESVRDALSGDPDLDGLDLRVAESRGVVTLSGRAADLDQYLRAIEAARSVDGVNTVVSRMVVEIRN